MRSILTFLLSLFLLTSFQQLLAQEKRDTGSIKEYKNEFWDSIKTAMIAKVIYMIIFFFRQPSIPI